MRDLFSRKVTVFCYLRVPPLKAQASKGKIFSISTDSAMSYYG